MDTLKEHIDELHGLANLLIEKETINREEFVAFIDTYKEPEPEPVTDAE
jgi:ATP-dependent Zn protease